MSIKCKICNEEFERFIHWRHLKLHNLTSDDYKSQYGDISDPLVYQMPPERKAKISESVKKFALDNTDEMKRRTQLAIQTKINNGYDFGSAMRGKHQSDYAKEKSKDTIAKVNHQRKIVSDKQITAALQTINLKLNNAITDITFDLTCLTCNSNFTFTKQYFQPSKFFQEICPTCFPRSKPVSNKEKSLFDYVKSLCPTAISSYRPKYHDREIDIFIPEMMIGIEFNGLYWHSEEVLLNNNRDKLSDFQKLQWANSNGIRLIQIFEDEWDLSADIVKSRLSNILQSTDHKIYARQCSVKTISGSLAAQFCNANHIMGKGRSNACYGLFHQGTLVSVMTFSKSNISRKVFAWELNRFCSITDFNVVGGASKLFTAFIRQHNPENIVSYSDNRWSNGGVYHALGFIKKHNGTPNYWYVKPNYPKRIHRYTLRKPSGSIKSESELRLSEGYKRIWDCGSSKWEWTNPNNKS